MYRMVSTQIFCRVITVIICLMTAASCRTYRTLSIDVLEPAQVLLKNKGKIAYYDRNIRYKSDNAYFLRTYDIPMRTQASGSFFEGLAAGLKANDRQDTVLLMEERKITFPEIFPPAEASQAELRRLFQTLNLQYIITLEYQHITKQETGSGFQTEWLLRLYSKDNITAIDTFIHKEPVKYTVPSDNEYLEEDSWNIGYHYAERLVPHWKNSVRRVYNKGKVLRLGDSFLKGNNTDQAFNVWEAALGKSPQLTIKAAINIAWLYENAGDFELAWQILSNALQQAKEQNIVNEDVDYLNKYLKIIEERIKAKEQLDMQL